MSFTTLAALGIVVAASVAIVAVGSYFKWDVTAKGYATWNRVIGVIAALGITGVVAWDKRADALSAVLIALGGCGLAVGFVLLHRNLTAKVRAALEDSER
jgi:uncharacterized membrane protein